MPAYVSAVSAVLLLAYYAFALLSRKPVTANGLVYDHGRTTRGNLMFNIARLASVLGLLALAAVSLVRNLQTDHWTVDAVLCAVYVRSVNLLVARMNDRSDPSTLLCRDTQPCYHSSRCLQRTQTPAAYLPH